MHHLMVACFFHGLAGKELLATLAAAAAAAAVWSLPWTRLVW
jgi:hypothetical protein